jgi:hypothetical protein
MGRGHRRGDGCVITPVDGRHSTRRAFRYSIDDKLTVPATEMKKDGELWRRSRLRQVKYLNNIVEQDHRRVKRLSGPGLGFGGFWTARRTLAGYEAMAMIKKGQVRNIRAATSGPGPGRIHRWTVPGGRLRRHLILSRMTRDQRSIFATEPSIKLH